MVFVINIIQWTSLATTFLFAAKLIEMTFGFISAIRSRRSYARDLTAAVKRWEISGFNRHELDEIRQQHGWFRSRMGWPITKRFSNLPPPMRSFFMRLFRYRWLLPLEFSVLLIATNRFILCLGVLLLTSGIWIGIICLLVDRLVFGFADSYFMKTYANLSGKADDPDYLRTETHEDRVQNFFMVFIGMVVIVMISYAGIYTAVDKLAGDAGAFQNITHDWTRIFHLLYFSIVTITTVGYGDVLPRFDSIFARLLTASEILAGFMLLVVLVTSVSMTFDRE